MLRHIWMVLALGCHWNAPVDPAAVRLRCAELVAQEGLPQSVADVTAGRAAGAHWTDREIRQMYVCAAASIGEANTAWVAEGIGAEERAQRAFDARHSARLVARAMMEDAGEVAALQARDQEKYGNPDGPTFAWLVAQNEAAGLTGDAVYEAIVESSQRTDPATNRLLGIR